MKYSVGVKFIAIVLCALMLSGAAVSGLCLGLLANLGLLGDTTVRDVQTSRAGERVRWYAAEMVSIWAAGEYGEVPEMVLQKRKLNYGGGVFPVGTVFFSIPGEDGEDLYSDYDGQTAAKYIIKLTNVRYEHCISFERVEEDETLSIAPMPEEHEVYNYRFENDTASGTDLYDYSYYLETIPEIKVVVYLTDGAIDNGPEWVLAEKVDAVQNKLPWVLGGCLLLFAALAVYLCCAAGHRPGSDEIRPGGLNRLPLDLYAFCVGGTVALSVLILEESGDLVDQGWQMIPLVWGSVGYLCCLVFVGFCFAAVAQLKAPKFFWFWHSVTGMCVYAAIYVAKKAFGLLPGLWSLILRIARAGWKVAMALTAMVFGLCLRIWNGAVRILRRVLDAVEHFFSLLPLTWQWLGAGMGMLLIYAYAVNNAHGARGILLGAMAWMAIVLYGCHAFGTLLDAVKKLRSGDLEAKVDDKLLVGSFREFSEELNGLADVAVVAAQKQLKSERMKTELITNVSHDIKTPLTSIINYVDLLEKPHTPEQEKTYLEVLSRQSQRMKKLIEDLMEMSKASTGNIPVEITRIDAVEAVNQALGEFSDKLTAAGLVPVFHQPEGELYLLADGRLLWRAMSNILSNAVKYAMPGTRLYVDVAEVEDKAVISFKNISGAQLNISADELMERFVRGDSSRNTEGSGLGLNIAKSLMELQKGQLQLLVDGDLFKVTLIFPIAK